MTKILLVEDDKSLREIYGVRLLAEGYDIVSAGDGEEALAMAIKERPHLIVSDVMMPKISGFDMLDILRSTSETRDIKVIMMTALSSEDQRVRGEQLGADRYLVKSQVGIEDVVRTVHEVLGDQAQPQTAAAQQPQATPAPVVSRLPMTPSPDGSDTAQGSFPEPTAPFSSPRPATLGERVIQPLDNPRSEEIANIGDRIDAVLNNQNPDAPATNHAEPEAPAESAPQPAPAPEQPQPAPQAPAAQPQPQQPQAAPVAAPQPPRPPADTPHGAQPYTPPSRS